MNKFDIFNEKIVNLVENIELKENLLYECNEKL